MSTKKKIVTDRQGTERRSLSDKRRDIRRYISEFKLSILLFLSPRFILLTPLASKLALSKLVILSCHNWSHTRASLRLGGQVFVQLQKVVHVTFPKVCNCLVALCTKHPVERVSEFESNVTPIGKPASEEDA